MAASADPPQRTPGASGRVDPGRVGAIARSPRFAELGRARRRAVVCGLGVFAAWYGGFLVCSAAAPHFMGQALHRHFTIAYAWALSLIVLTWALIGAYLRYASRRLDPLVSEILAEDERGPRA